MARNVQAETARGPAAHARWSVAPTLPLPSPAHAALVPLNGARLLRGGRDSQGTAALVWSQQVLVRWPGPPPPAALLTALGVLHEGPPLEVALEQFKVVKAAIAEALEGPEPPRGPPGGAELRAMYAFFDDQLRIAPECAEQLTAAGLARDAACVLVQATDVPGAGAGAGVRPMWRFVAPRLVFRSFEHLPGVPAYELEYGSALRYCGRLMDHLGVRSSPTTADLTEMLQTLGQRVADASAAPDGASALQKLRLSMVRLATLLAQRYVRRTPAETGDTADQAVPLLLVNQHWQVACATCAGLCSKTTGAGRAGDIQTAFRFAVAYATVACPLPTTWHLLSCPNFCCTSCSLVVFGAGNADRDS